MNDKRHLRFDVQRRVARLLAARGLRWRMDVAAVGAVARIRPGLDVQKMSDDELLVARDGNFRRVSL